MNILLQGRIAVSGKPYLEKFAAANWKIDCWDPDSMGSDAFASLAENADVIIGGNIPVDPWPPAPKLSLFQIPWAGFNHTGPERVPVDVPVCNCFEHESCIAEFVMLGLLEWEIRLGRKDEKMRTVGWDGRIVGVGGSYHGEVAGKTIGFVGYGHIAEAIAKRAAAFDMNLIAVRRSSGNKPANLHWMGGQDDLPELLQRSDYVVVACDLNQSTRDMFDHNTLALMKSSAVLVNVSRGGIVNERALYDALVNKDIAGAIIDCWYNYNEKGKAEVCPYNFPFNQLDNIIMSAHESAWTEGQVMRRWQFIAENIVRVESGDPPLNHVFTGTAISSA